MSTFCQGPARKGSRNRPLVTPNSKALPLGPGTLELTFAQPLHLDRNLKTKRLSSKVGGLVGWFGDVEKIAGKGFKF